MKKRIYLNMMLLTSLSILLVSVVLCAIFYNQFAARIQKDLRQRVQIFHDNSSAEVLRELAEVTADDMRVTVISAEGSVEYDNMVAASGLESHLGREEIDEALSFGEGESSRFSDTLQSRTYYYAIKLSDGDVLRVSKTVGSMWRTFVSILPVMLLVIIAFLFAGYFISKGLAGRVVEPINEIDLEREPVAPYDELTPFVRTIARHREQIVTGNDELRRRTETTSAIMDNMSEGVLILDSRGIVLSMNKSAGAIFGMNTAIEGRSVLELLRDVDFSSNAKKALAGSRGEMNYAKGDKLYRVMMSPVARIGVVILFLDITENFKGEKLRREFSANVSHELKTPLTSIYGNAEMLHEDIVKEPDRKLFYKKIMDEASRLITLIEDIMLISQLDEGGKRDVLEKVELAATAKECADALAQKAQSSNISISVEGEGTVNAARTMMYEMFYNLIENGIKYNKPGGFVKVLISQSGEDTIVTVSDNGIGIQKDDQTRIFERFFRAERSRSKKSGGTGLGLAIVKHIVLVHGGEITVESSPGEGTEFIIRFKS